MAYTKQNFQDGQILTAANLEKMENGIIAGQGVRNLLDNSDFSNPVNSKGKSSYSTNGNEYTIDRWKTQYGTGLTIENGYINVIGNWQIYQTIKNPKDGVYTFAVEARINAIGDYTPNIDIGGKIETSLGTNIGEWKTHILQYDLSTITDETIILSIAARGGSSSGSISVRWAALYKGSYTVDTLPDYVPKGKHVEMLNCNVPLAPRNLLDNSDFRNPVNQRGATSYSSQWAYSIDRWYLPGSTVPVTVGEGYVSFNAADQFIGKAITNGYYTLAVKLLDGRIFVGSAYYTAGVSSTMLANNGVVDSYLMGDAGSGNHPRLRIQTVSGEALSFVWAALYEGFYTADTLPPYVPKGYETELAACHYYYQVIPEQTSCAFATTAQSDKYFASSINFSPMRITPTVSLKKDSSGYIGVVQGVSFVSASEFDFAYKLNGTLLPATTNANYAGKVMSFYGVELSADL